MTSKPTPDGADGARALLAIRYRTEERPGPGLRREELDLLRDWHEQCEDLGERRELSRILSIFG